MADIKEAISSFFILVFTSQMSKLVSGRTIAGNVQPQRNNPSWLPHYFWREASFWPQHSSKPKQLPWCISWCCDFLLGNVYDDIFWAKTIQVMLSMSILYSGLQEIWILMRVNTCTIKKFICLRQFLRFFLIYLWITESKLPSLKKVLNKTYRIISVTWWIWTLVKISLSNTEGTNNYT